MTTYDLFPATNGPSSSTSYSGSIVEGVLFEVTASGYALQGYRFWRADSSQSASASFALWQATGMGTGTLIAGSQVSTATLVAGQWNYVPLPTPIALTSGQVYKAQVGLTGNFPFTGSYYTAPVTDGPLTAFPDSGLTGHDTYNDFQCTFDTSTSDPASVYATTANSSYNCWLDILIGPSSTTQNGAAALAASPALTAAASVPLMGAAALSGPATLSAAATLARSGAAALAATPALTASAIPLRSGAAALTAPAALTAAGLRTVEAAAALAAAPALGGAAFRTQHAAAAFSAPGTLSGAADLTVTFVSTDGSNVSTYNVTSPLNNTGGAGTVQMRVLAPTSPNPAYAHSFLWMLPVESGQGTSFGDSIATALALNAHNDYNLTVIQPGYATDPWLADNPGDPSTSQESFTLALVSWARSSLAVTGREKNYLIGFSKSGIGGQGLQFRHPALFAATASWDAPFAMTSYAGADPFGTVGGGSAAVYGTNANFTSGYELSSGNLTAWGAPFQAASRLWIGGYYAFQGDVGAYETLLTSLGIQHTGTWNTLDTSHAWHTGWVANALSSVIAPIPIGSGSAALAAAPALSAAGTRVLPAQAHLAAAASLTAPAVRSAAGAAHLAAAPAFAPDATRVVPGQLHLAAAAALSAGATRAVLAQAHLPAAPVLTAGTAPLVSAQAPLSASPALVAAVTRAAPGSAGLAAGALLGVSGSVTAGGVTVLAGTASLAGAAALAASGGTGTDRGGLWDAYQAARDQASKLWEQWHMMKAITRTDGTAGFLYGQAYEAEQAADLAYEAYLAALRIAYGSRG